MAGQLNSMVGRLQKQAAELSLAQKVFSVLLLGGLVLGVMTFSTWASKPSMAPLFANLSQEDAAAIVDQLSTEGVPYELTAGGSTIMVPQSQLYDTRLSIAAAGLPGNSDTGYALLDNMSMTSSEFQQQVTYQRALEGELAKTIGAIDGVEVASVKLAIPEDSIFVETKAAPTASVFVQTKAGMSLSGSTVQAIVHLVSASIEGMATQDVAVIDSNGVVLSSVGGDASTIMQASQIADYESRVAANVQQMLDQVVGIGNAVVSVSADLDYDKTQRVTESFSAAPTIPALSESTSTEQYSGSGSTDTGVLGPDNISVPTAGATGDGAYIKEESVRNNAINKVTETLETAPGTVRRQSVSVVISAEAGGDLKIADIEAMVAAAAGVDATRGDVVSVSRMSFNTTAAEQAQAELEVASEVAKADATRTMYIGISKWASLGIIVVALIIVVMMAGRRVRETDKVTLSLEAVEELESRTQAALDARAQAALDRISTQGELVAAPLPEMEQIAAGVREEIMAFASAQPAEVAEVLRGWLSQGRRS